MVTCATFGLLAGLGMLASRSEAHVPFEARRLLRIILIVVTASALMLVLDNRLGEAFSPASVSMRAAICLVLLGGMWHGVLRADERESIRGWLAARLGRSPGGAA